MTELEKFKRRMIRIVARLHLKEKKPEEELWEDLKKETKCDCKWLWERMRTLTLKRLKRLIIADDRHECITNIARMSLTDWLLYDLILVHEKIDVIGAELMGEKKVEPRPLFELFSLVQRFELEGLTGDRLASAWTAATYYYNSNGRQCSPMLLQRRWYQMKEATRNRFYKFWFTYRGNLKLLHVAFNDAPTRLQMAIAKRYPHVITRTFLSWEDMIEKRMVILPDEFQIKMKNTQAMPKPPENDPDLVLLEPEIETIDLRVDSDSDNELKQQVESEESANISDMETANALAGIGATPKLEPEEISIDDDFGDIGALENIEIPMESTSVEVNDNQELNTCIEQVTENQYVEDDDQELSACNEQVTENQYVDDDDDQELSACNEQVTVNQYVDDDDQELSACNEQVTESVDPKIIQDTDQEVSNNSDQVNESAEPEITQQEDEIQPQVKQKETDKDVETIDDNTEELIQTSVVVPQITNVFGNVHIEVEALVKLSEILDKKMPDAIPHDVEPLCKASNQNMQRETPQTKIYSCDDDDEEIEEDIIKTEIIDENYIRPEFNANVNSAQISELSVMNTDINKTIKFDETKIKKAEPHINNFEKVATDLTFDDDGIEFEDDGIVVDNNEQFIEPTKSPEDISVQTEHHCKNDNEEEVEETAKFDLKLLMDPVVYTKKIDEMCFFNNITVFNARCKEHIDLILAESKPTSKKNINYIEEEKLQSPCDDEDDDHKIDDDLFDNRNIKEEEVSSSCDSENHDSKIVDDLFDNMSNGSDSDYVPENKKLNLTSTLLQKPRNRNYNPITLCKNPDFNTRLKRLTVGFLSSTRNRRLLNACKPLTIDVSKSFESKIINNILYLKSCSNNVHINKENKTDDKFNESQHTTSVMPSAMPAQSLIDIMKMNMEGLINKQCQRINEIQKPIEENSISYERNKVINLPHIDNVRRINQKLLVAEVSPIQVHPAEVCIPPVQIIPHQNLDNDEILKDRPSEIHPIISASDRNETDVSSGKVICSGTVIRGTNHQFMTHGVNFTASTSKRPCNFSKRTSLESMFNKYKLNAGQYQLNRKRPKPLDWTFGKRKPLGQTLQSYTDEYLITVDTLNKMLNLMDESRNNPVKTMILQDSAKKLSKSKAVMKRKLELQEKLCEYERRIKGDLNQPPGTNVDSTIQPSPNANQKKRRRPKVSKSGKSKTIVNYGQSEKKDTVEPDESIKKACESIESVVQQTRELIDNKTKSSPNINTAMNTVDASTSTTDANTVENTDDTIEIDDTCKDVSDTPIEITIDMQDSASSIQQTPIALLNDTNFIDKSSTSTVLTDSVTVNPVSTNEVTSNAIPVDDVTPSQVSSVINNDVIEIDDSPLDASVAEVNNLLPSNNLFSDDHSKATDERPSPIVRRRRPPKIKTKITSAQKSVRQQSAVSSVSRGHRYQYASCIKDTDDNNEMVLFLSSKSLSKEPNAQPIFLGKNKILLTDVHLPRIQSRNPAGIVISQYIDQSTVSLPKGVDFVVLPNGELTCTIAPDTHLDYEQLALIPTLLSSLRQQLSGGTTLIPPQAIPNFDVPNAALAENISEVVNISDDENVSKNFADDQLTANNASNGNVITLSNDVPEPSTSASIVQNTNELGGGNLNESISEKATIFENADTVKINSKEFNNETKKCDNKYIESSTLEHNIQNIDTVLEIPENNSANINKTMHKIDSDNNVEVENDTTNPVVDVDETNEKTQGDQSVATKKTILSDLMEMSGIFEEDTIPSYEADEITKDVLNTQPISNPTLVVGTGRDESGSKVVTPSLVTQASQVAFGNTVINLPELNPITSFAELKYAFENSGKFFKLDVTTRVLAPINVCIKKNKENNTVPAIAPKMLMVDLTDENDEPVTTKTGNDTRETQIEVSVTENQSTETKIQKPISIKPLKLFKVTRPNILRGCRKANTNTDSRLVSILKRHKLQKSNSLLKETNKTKEKENPNKNACSEVNIVEDSDDSSDDEPLAKKVRRKNELKDIPVPNRIDDVEPACENVLPDNDRMEQTCLPIDNLEQTEKCLPIDNLEHVESSLPNQEEDLAESNESTVLEPGLPTELSFISDHENDGSDEELCILGV